ncbi:MAG: ABC transporter permease [Fulvivirga sp.]
MTKIINWLYEGNRMERIWLLSQIEFKLRYYGNKLGLIWALLNPIAKISMFYVMFVHLMGVRMDNFVLYLFSGFVIWIFFTDVTNRSIIILKAKQSLYENTNMDKVEIYISLIVSCTIGLIFNLSIYIVLSMISGLFPTWHYIYFILIYINLTLLSLGIAMILSNLFLLFKDVSQLWNIATTVLFFLSPILFRGELVAEKLPIIIYLNPLAGIINNTRAILMEQQVLDWGMLGYNYAYALVLVFIGIYMLKVIAPKSSELV